MTGGGGTLLGETTRGGNGLGRNNPEPFQGASLKILKFFAQVWSMILIRGYLMAHGVTINMISLRRNKRFKSRCVIPQ